MAGGHTLSYKQVRDGFNFRTPDMANFHTFKKGHIGLSKATTRLIEMDWDVYIPFTDQCVADLIVVKEKQTYLLQAKYCSISSEGSIEIRNRSGYFKKRKTTAKYTPGDFDFYCVYVPELDEVLFPHFKFGGRKIRCFSPKTDATAFLWWKDFLNFQDTEILKRKSDVEDDYMSDTDIENIIRKRKLRNCKCGGVIKSVSKKVKRCIKCAAKETSKPKIIWPSNEELQKLVWEKPSTTIAKELKISDTAFVKHCRKNNIEKPPRGYWQKLKSQK